MAGCAGATAPVPRTLTRTPRSVRRLVCDQVVWGKYAQVTNNPDLDGCINAVLLV